ncbi:hypothetical protein ACHAQH_006779 [Verticillium albo-atrum]
MFRMNLGVFRSAPRARLGALRLSRSLATAAEPAKLPLDGVRVLDLSRVLAGVNRNKKSLALSFKEERGAEILRDLAKKVDVVVENYLPGSLKKYGLDYETLRKLNPKLIYASITGYGQFGPYSNRAGYDVMVEAVKHRGVLEKWIEDVTLTKTTQEWLDIFDGTGLPYAKVNDLMDTTKHQHGKKIA